MLKSRLLEEYGRTKYQAIVDLLENTHQLPNEKPSQYLRRLQQANEGNTAGDKVVLKLLLQSLPEGMQETQAYRTNTGLRHYSESCGRGPRI